MRSTCFLGMFSFPPVFSPFATPLLTSRLSSGCLLVLCGQQPRGGGERRPNYRGRSQNRAAFPLVHELVRGVGVLVLSAVLEQQEGGVTGRRSVLHGFKLSSE